MMKPEEAISRLRDMQSQIIHGKNTFGEIANVIERLENELAATEAERDGADKVIENLKHELQNNWTASLCDRLNELVRENRSYFKECHDGPTASLLIGDIHGKFNELRHATTKGGKE